MALTPCGYVQALRRNQFPRAKISICQSTTKYLTFEEDVRAYIASDIDGISLSWEKVSAIGAKKARSVLWRHGLDVVSMSGAPSLLPQLNGTIEDVVSSFIPILNVCADVNAPILAVAAGSSAGRSSVESFTTLESCLRLLLPEAKSRNVILALEPMSASYLDAVNSLNLAVELLDALAHPNLKLLFNVWECAHEGNVKARIRSVVDNVALVRLSDMLEWSDPNGERVLPGHGILPLRGILREFWDCGYRGTFDVELHSPRLWAGNQDSILEYCRRFFDRVWENE